MNMKININNENLRNNIDIIPFLSYPDANKCKTIIFKQNKGKELAKLRRGKETSFYGKNHKPESLLKISIKLSILVRVLNVETGCSNTFLGNKEAAKYLNIGTSTLRRYKKLNKLIKDKYLISNV